MIDEEIIKQTTLRWLFANGYDVKSQIAEPANRIPTFVATRKADNTLLLVAVRDSRKNLSYVLHQLNASLTEFPSAQLALAMPEAVITSHLRERCKASGILLIALPIEDCPPEHQERVGLSVKLVPGKDDDLIAWLQSIPEGQRNTVVKTALRAYASHTAQDGTSHLLTRFREEMDEVFDRYLPSSQRGVPITAPTFSFDEQVEKHQK